jgi:hypothetical protein
VAAIADVEASNGMATTVDLMDLLLLRLGRE